MAKLNDAQIRWQRAALDVLLRADEFAAVYRPWIKSNIAVEAIAQEGNCTAQAGSGALRALLTVGLAARSETSDGSFWKATDAAVRAAELLARPEDASTHGSYGNTESEGR